MASQQPEAASRPGGQKTAVTNVRMFDGHQLVPGSTVVIAAGLIGTDPAGAQIIYNGSTTNVAVLRPSLTATRDDYATQPDDLHLCLRGAYRDLLRLVAQRSS